MNNNEKIAKKIAVHSVVSMIITKVFRALSKYNEIDNKIILKEILFKIPRSK